MRQKKVTKNREITETIELRAANPEIIQKLELTDKGFKK